MSLARLRQAPHRIPSRGHPHRGHAHFWQRAAMKRRRLMRTAAGGTAAALGAPLWLPALAQAERDDGHARRPNGAAPRPIPGGQQFFGPGTEVFHVFLGPDVENSTITDFNGVIAAAHILGTVTEIQGNQRTSGLLVDGDVRFMQGVYIGVDGKARHGTFGFF
jgi:hypothetical protein